MVEEVKVLLGPSTDNYSEAQIGLALKLAIDEVETYCNRALDGSLELIAERIAVIKLNRMNTEGLERHLIALRWTLLKKSGVPIFLHGYGNPHLYYILKAKLLPVWRVAARFGSRGTVNFCPVECFRN